MNGNGTDNDSILIDVRVACNVDETDQGFDMKLVPLINSQMMMAHEFGIGFEGFSITGPTETWQDWLGEDAAILQAAKTWLGYTVLLLFDPPENSTVLKSYQDQILKMEWMLCNKSQLSGAIQNFVPNPYSVEDTEED